MSKYSVLVTGADGFIGSHLTEALVREGFNVKAFVLYNSFNSWGWLDHCDDDIKGQFEIFIRGKQLKDSLESMKNLKRVPINSFQASIGSCG